MIKRLNLDEHGSTGCRLAIVMKLSRQINISLSIDDTSICSGAICLQCSPDLVQSLKWSVFENNFKNPNACRKVLVQRVWWSGKLSPTSCGTPTPLAKHLVQGISEGGSVYKQMINIFIKMILFPSPLSYINSKLIVQTSHAKRCDFCRKNLNNKWSSGWCLEFKESKQMISLLVFHHVLRK